MAEVEPLTAGEEIFLTNLLIVLKGPVEFECEYRNWRGEVATRRLRAVAFWHGSTEWHPKPGLMLKAVDLDKDAERDFAVADFNMATLCAVHKTHKGGENDAFRKSNEHLRWRQSNGVGRVL